MWGNRIGWAISAVEVLIFALIIWGFLKLGELTPPTSFINDSVLTQPLALPVAPETIVSMTQDTDAGPLYRKAIEDYRANEDRYDKLLTAGKPDLLSTPAGVQAILDGAPMRRMTLFEQSPGGALAYTLREKADLQALSKVGDLTIRLALFHATNGNKPRARELYEAAFALGAKLFQERVSYAELSAGLGLMAGAAEGLRRHVAEGEEVEKLTAFLEGYRTYSPRLREVQEKIDSISPRVSYRHAGDVFHIIRTPAYDRMWRAEALMKAGRYRFDAGRAADQRGVPRIVQPYTNDPDPVIRHAANAALNLTREQYMKLGA